MVKRYGADGSMPLRLVPWLVDRNRYYSSVAAILREPPRESRPPPPPPSRDVYHENIRAGYFTIERSVDA